MKRVAVAVVGSLLALAGIALLVLPGPGFVLIAAGLAVLATQFAWAKKPLDYAKEKAQEGIEEVSKSGWRTAFAGICAAALLTIGILELTPLEIPFLTTLSAILLIFSGLGLLATLVYARVVAARKPADQSDSSLI